MPYFALKSIAPVRTAIDAMSAVHGGYTAIDLLTKALGDVEEPEDFQSDVRRLEAKQGLAYQGPEGAGREVVKAVKTAAEADPQEQDALLQLVSLVLVKLGTSQGARVLSLLLAAAGFDASLLIVVVRLCILLAQTEAGRKIVASAGPGLKSAFDACAERARLVEPLQRLTATLGQQGYELAAAIADMPVEAAKSALHAGKNLADMIGNQLGAPAAEPSEPRPPS